MEKESQQQRQHQEEQGKRERDQLKQQEEKQKLEDPEKHRDKAEEEEIEDPHRQQNVSVSNPVSTLKSKSSPSDSPPDSPLSSSSLSHGSSPALPSQASVSNPEKDDPGQHNDLSASIPAPALKSKSPPSGSPSDSPLSSSSLSHGPSPSPPSRPSVTRPPPSAVAAAAVKVGSGAQDGASTGVFDEQKGGASGSKKRLRPDMSLLKSAKREKLMRKVLLGFRLCVFAFCLVSFSVLAADRNRGWALDSFYRYKEFRYTLAVNVIGFVYSGLQAYDLAYKLAIGKQKLQHRLRFYLDFGLDQILTYLLISASSSAVVRVEDWQSNWGKDPFPQMASASVGLSIVAFVASAMGSLMSGYALFTLRRG